MPGRRLIGQIRQAEGQAGPSLRRATKAEQPDDHLQSQAAEQAQAQLSGRRPGCGGSLREAAWSASDFASRHDRRRRDQSTQPRSGQKEPPDHRARSAHTRTATNAGLDTLQTTSVSHLAKGAHLHRSLTVRRRNGSPRRPCFPAQAALGACWSPANAGSRKGRKRGSGAPESDRGASAGHMSAWREMPPPVFDGRRGATCDSFAAAGLRDRTNRAPVVEHAQTRVSTSPARRISGRDGQRDC